MDMLVLPEMALTGYIFSNHADIEPLLEDPYDTREGSSPSLKLAKELAIRLECYVVIGFPMRQREGRTTGTISSFDARPAHLVSHEVAEGSQGCYNAALLVDSQGQLVHVFKKHFSYEDDKRWATESAGFQSIDLPKLGKVCVAICMDLSRESIMT
jgi:protein N-terminal amidase